MTITNDSKNNLSISNESKGMDKTWAEHTETWEEAEKSTWAVQKMVIIKEGKNNLVISNETKL